MSDDLKQTEGPPVVTPDADEQRYNRRNLPLAGTTLATTSALSAASHRARAGADVSGRQAEHPCHLGRRHRHCEYQRLFAWADGLSDAEYRSHRPRGHLRPDSILTLT